MFKKYSIRLVITCALLIMSAHNFSYGQVKRDTVRVNESEFDEPITYSARDSIYSDIKAKQVHLYGQASLQNEGITMNAGYIMIDLNNNEVLATYSYDKDSNKVDLPKFTDGSEEINAETIRYNFDTEKGFIEGVSIDQDETHLYMGVAKRHANEEIHFLKGRFSTCDLDEPHYHFQLSRAVLIPDKRIVSGPMNLWVQGVPTFIGLPFSIIPQVEEKNKGLIFPDFVPLSNYGFGIQDLGYYFPVNDRFQTTFYGSLYSRGSWGLRNVSDYAKIYKFKGSFDLGFQQFKSGFPDNTNLNKVSVRWQHNMDPKANPYWRFSSNVNFISDNNTKNNLDPLNDNYFNNQLNSDVNITRSFPGKPITAGMKMNVRQNSQSGKISLTSPVVNVNVTRFFPFKKWFNTNDGGLSELMGRFGMTYSFEGQNRVLFADTLLRDGNFNAIGDQFMNGINQTITMQTTAGLFKNTWKLTPSVSYNNKINFQQTSKTYDTVNTTIITDTIQRTGTAHSVSANIQLTTALYSYYKYIGKRNPIVRHVLTPSFNFRYIPNLSQSYIQNLTVDTTVVSYSSFERSLYSVGTTKDQALLSFTFNNTLELKVKSDKDTVEGFKRTRLIDAFSIQGNYDFLKDTMKLSDLNLNLRISPASWVNFVASSTFSPYSWYSNGAKKSEYAINDKGVLGRFLSANLATTVTITSKKSRQELKNNIESIETNWNADYNYFLLHPEHAINFNIPWKVSLSHNFAVTANQSISSYYPDRYTSIQTIMFNGDVSFTKRWKIATRTNFDLKNLQITNSRFTLTRDMHCWALAFHWTPIGGNQSFLFSIRSTSQLFQDAKFDLRKPPAFL